jgi:lipopolysaccharide transport system ATP-binding protein
MNVVTVSGVGKKFEIHHDHAGPVPTTFREAVSQEVSRVLGWRKSSKYGSSKREDFWALRDVSFTLKEGTKLGIIGRNGAGKSTLLKILARITPPTEGRALLRGRVASLLEVGTGFHPELTGRENIFMNGALLGMSRQEVRTKLDQIVEFSGVAPFLDLAVKHYSSGMYVRLAFAVAAHVDPEILILDEVLAVGDIQFQRKCFGKMEELGDTARSVILVSHDLNAVSAFCDRCILLEAGRIAFDGTPSDAIQRYYGSTLGKNSGMGEGRQVVGDGNARLLSMCVSTGDDRPTSEVDIGQPLKVTMTYRLLKELDAPAVPNFHFFRPDGTCAFNAQAPGVRPLPAGDYIASVVIPPNFLNEGPYSIGFALTTYFAGHHNVNFYERNALVVNVRDPRDDVTHRYGYPGEFLGVIRPKFDTWVLSPLKDEP